MHPLDGRVVSNFIRQALFDEPLTVFGNGQQTRSFCYVTDLIDGLVRLMDSPESFTGPVNLGNASEFTVLELAHKIIFVYRVAFQIESRPLPPDDPVQRRPDISLARKELDWAPQVSLDEGLKKTIEYFDVLFRSNQGNPALKRVLVTGAAGYVGSHTCKALARRGFDPIGLDSLERAGVRELPWAPVEIIDTADFSGISRVLEKYRPAAVVHFAAYAYVGESVANPLSYYRNNLSGSITLLDAVQAAGIGNFVFSSSCATYGIPPPRSNRGRSSAESCQPIRLKQAHGGTGTAGFRPGLWRSSRRTALF